MTDWREELIEAMTRKMWRVEPDNNTLMLEDLARAALAVAEPVIREQCAKICEGDFDSEMKGYGAYFAAAIREGGKE